jgi:putative protease
MRLRTPTIIRPEERCLLNKWLALDLPLTTGHIGLLAEQSAAGRNVVADYATNCFNPHSASAIFRAGASGIVLSIELTTDEIADVVRPWGGKGFSVVTFGRPEGMTIEHCVLSAAFDRKVATCRDLCVQKHPNVHLTDGTGYAFPVATDANCRNRLLHSRPIDGSAFMGRLWKSGIRSYKLLLNVPHLPVADLVKAYRTILGAAAAGVQPPYAEVRTLLAGEYTRGHFARAV